MKHVPKVITISLLALVLSASAPPATHATGLIAGATEFTQIANNIQLVVGYAKQLQQYKTQLDQFKEQVFALRQMDPRKLKGMLKGALGLDSPAELEKAYRDAEKITDSIQGISEGMETIYSEGHLSLEVARALAKKGVTITPNDYIEAFRALGKTQQETYGRRLTALNDAAKNVLSDIKRVDEIAANSESIQTNIEGFQTIAQANAVMSNQLGTLTQVLTQQATMDTENAKRIAREMAERDESKMLAERHMRMLFSPIEGTSKEGK